MASNSDWSRYWASGAVHSCLRAFDGNYNDEVRDFWLDFFGAVPDGAQVLDIGTGNGAVAVFASEAATGKGATFRIIGIDAARIDPAQAAAKLGIDVSHISFMGETSGEHTDFPDQCFDAISSQFAVEYMDRDKVVPELARILKPGGRIGFVIHHTGSVSVAVTRAELEAFQFLREQAPLLTRVIGFIHQLQLAEASDTLLEKLGADDTRAAQLEIEGLLTALVAKAKEHPGYGFLDGIAKQTAQVLGQTPSQGPAATLPMLQELEAEVLAHEARLAAMISAAMDAAGIEGFCARLAAAGFAVDQPGELYRNGTRLLGWTVRASRAS